MQRLKRTLDQFPDDHEVLGSWSDWGDLWRTREFEAGKDVIEDDDASAVKFALGNNSAQFACNVKLPLAKLRTFRQSGLAKRPEQIDAFIANV